MGIQDPMEYACDALSPHQVSCPAHRLGFFTRAFYLWCAWGTRAITCLGSVRQDDNLVSVRISSQQLETEASLISPVHTGSHSAEQQVALCTCLVVLTMILMLLGNCFMLAVLWPWYPGPNGATKLFFHCVVCIRSCSTGPSTYKSANFGFLFTSVDRKRMSDGEHFDKLGRHHSGASLCNLVIL